MICDTSTYLILPRPQSNSHYFSVVAMDQRCWYSDHISLFKGTQILTHLQIW
jgi:hypothetical protein